MATKKEQIAQEVARAVGAGKAVAMETVDFSDPNRPKTCLEVDFPILPVNQVAVIEGNAGKPIYQMSKWWARRRSSVFRSMLIAAATKAPEDPSHAAKLVWDNYYANHQKKGAFKHLKVADIFMGGGTTLVEGSRLGMQMSGNDLNPVAWFVVKQELADVDLDEVKRLLADIEAEVKPQIMPFYYCDGPNGEKGTWTHKPSGKVMGADFDPLALKPEERKDYSYDGPEIIYTFWAKHGPCQVTGCGHRTPIMTDPVMAVKTLTVKHWAHECRTCSRHFDIEDAEARMAPEVPLYVAPDEKPYSILDPKGRVICPHCGHTEMVKLDKGKNKKVDLTLLVHPEWLAGSPKTGPDGTLFGGAPQDDAGSFLMSEEERGFYEKLREYLEDGFDLAKRKGNQGRALGFLMAIFQKIAASSFAAVRRTLKRRMLMLTLHEALLRDRELDIEGRERLYDEARELIHIEWGLGRDPISRSEVDRVMADLKHRLAKKLDEDELELASDPYGSEFVSSHLEDLASAAIDLHLPEERLRIADLLNSFPAQRETKAQKLIDGLGVLWRQNPNEKIVIFATYLGTVDLIAKEIEAVYPGQGVAVLRGGDHGAKVAAERRFKQKDGPRVLVCTAAGREGINLQFARILFNFDLPWNPMDMEQRIGRIHRYGQNHTAQVYNLVLSDTIEGRIFLLLDDKLTEIARTLGKVDEQGNVAEDLRSQILGQLSERLNYDRLYQEALGDPELKRTAVELEAALSNAREAREVVFDLFQDLDGFSLDDYKPFSDVSSGMGRLVEFLSSAVSDQNSRVVKIDDRTVDLISSEGSLRKRFTLDRDTATENEKCDLMGLDHPLLQEELGRWRSVAPESLGVALEGSGYGPAVLTIWMIETSNSAGEHRSTIQAIAVNLEGNRLPAAERQLEIVLRSNPTRAMLSAEKRIELFAQHVEPTLQRELKHKGAAAGEGSYSAELIGYIELVS